MDREQTATHIRAIGGIAVIRGVPPERVVAVTEALVAGGISGVEITMTVAGAFDLIRVLDRQFGDRILLGVGSVVDAATCQQAIEAGARFVASPVFVPAVVARAHELGAATLPGALTPTEAFNVWRSGANFVKIFPAELFGPAYIRSLLAPLPTLPVIPTGGVTPENAGDWLRAGCAAVGIGSALMDQAAIAAGDYGALTAKAAIMRRSLDAGRTAARGK